ncbi:MAG: hypothetical protein C0485_07900 [Pirellula sp.]|nr:hypothetical protein [Pirellula sp.]
MTDKTCARGGILWLWATTANAENRGFELLFEATSTFTVPEDWQEMVPATRVRTGNKVVELGEHHNELLEFASNRGVLRPHTLEDGGECYATHTKLLEAAHKEMRLLGAFSTVSQGRDLQTPNCYIIPNDDGSWRVYRFGTAKEPGWHLRQSDQRSWCWFNQFDESDWGALCASFRGVNPSGKSKGTYVVQKFEDAAAIVAAAGGVFVPPQTVTNRAVTLTLINGQIRCEISRTRKETEVPEGWLEVSEKKFGCSIDLPSAKADRSSLYDIENVKVGYHFSEVGQQYGETLYYVQHDDGTWKPETVAHVRSMLISQGMPKAAFPVWQGKNIASPVKISCKPFAKASDDSTFWNRGYQFACNPIKGDHPTWDKVIRHSFEYLNPYINDDPWCQANRIKDGYDFGIVYCAMMVQNPQRRAPHLFLYSEDQGTGKDTFPDSIALLMESGAVVNANDAVTSSSGFNGEMEGKVIYKISEIDLSKSGSTAESRCRDWVTNPILHIHRKGITPYDVVNYGRVIQMANDLSYKLVSTEDARTIVIELAKISPANHLDWETELKPKLIAERAAFLYHLLNYGLPEHGAKGSRCYLPILSTEAKADSIAANLAPLQGNVAHLFEQIVTKAHRGEWQGELEYTDIFRLIDDVPPNSKSWGAAWRRMEPHFRAHGLNPSHRPRVEHKSSAAWGFAAA